MKFPLSALLFDNAIDKDANSDIIKGHDIDMDTYLCIIMYADVARILTYYGLLHPIIILLRS